MRVLIFTLSTLFVFNSFAFRDENPCVENVLDAVNSVDAKGSKLRVRNNKIIKKRHYTMAIINKLGIDNHFQGVQRLLDSEYFVFSGGDYNRKAGHIYVGKLGSKAGQEIWGRNRAPWRRTPKQDKLIAKIPVGSSTWWHPGGLQVIGDILVVPSEDYKVTNTAIIEFFDMSDPENPVRFEHTVTRTHQDAGGVAITKLANGKFLMGIHASPEIDFYVSRSKNIQDGFNEDKYVSWNKGNVQGMEGFKMGFGGSSMNFIKQCDGQLFAATFSNDGKTAPIFNGKDWMSVFKVEFNEGYSAAPTVTKIVEKALKCKGKCNFDAGVGTYVTPAGELHVYGINHFRNYWGNRINLREF